MLRQQETNYIMLAIVLAFGVFLIVGLLIIPAIEQAQAGCERGNAGSFAFNQSKGRCFDRGTIWGSFFFFLLWLVLCNIFRWFLFWLLCLRLCIRDAYCKPAAVGASVVIASVMVSVVVCVCLCWRRLHYFWWLLLSRRFVISIGSLFCLAFNLLWSIAACNVLLNESIEALEFCPFNFRFSKVLKSMFAKSWTEYCLMLPLLFATTCCCGCTVWSFPYKRKSKSSNKLLNLDSFVKPKKEYTLI